MVLLKEVPRRLAAIMFTDMVGYSSLVHRDEALGLELLREHHAIVRKAIADFSGREIDTAGDGFVVEFASAQSAVRCALQIQETFADRNRHQPPERRFKVRIGIHASDVVLTESEGKAGIYGDGVNLAARLQPLAPQGGICISRTVHDQIEGKVDCSVHFMGDTHLKGFDKPIRIYSVELRPPNLLRRVRRRLRHNIFSRRVAITIVAASILAPSTWWLSRSWRAGNASIPLENHRVAILPFETNGQDEAESLLAEGLSSGLISSLSQRGVRVLAKNSVVEIQKSRLRPQLIGRDLNIGRLVTGRVRRQGSDLAISVNIVDTRNEEVEWSKDYRARETTLFKTQTAIAEDLKIRLGGYTGAATLSALAAAPTNEAYLAYIRGQFFLGKRTREDFQKAGDEFEKAVKLDPNFAAAHAALAMMTNLQSWYGIKSPRSAELDVIRHANRALILDPGSCEALITLAEVKAYVEYDFTEAENLFRRALTLNDRHSTAHQWYAELLTYQGRFKEARAEIAKALEYDPLSLVTNSARAMTYYYERDFDRALGDLETLLNLDPRFSLAHYWKGRAWLEKGDVPRALGALRKAAELNPDDVMIKAGIAHALGSTGGENEARSILKSLSDRGKSSYVSTFHFAVIHAGLRDSTETLRLLRQAVDERASQTVSLLQDPRFDFLRENSEFQDIVKQITGSRN